MQTSGAGSKMKLGIVTYNIARAWDLDRILDVCGRLEYQGVELRTTHAHKVETDLSKAQRAEVKQRFADSPVELVGLGSAFEFHSIDPEEVRRNIVGAKEFVLLSKDVGGSGVKVRPNGLPEGVPLEQTTEQIGKALLECGEFAAEHGQFVRVEVHGRDTSHIPVFKQFMDVADHPNVVTCWNSNNADLMDGKLEPGFNMLKDRIGMVHLRDLYHEDYPWRELLQRLKGIGYEGFCLAEIGDSSDPERVLRYYRALWKSHLS